MFVFHFEMIHLNFNACFNFAFNMCVFLNVGDGVARRNHVISSPICPQAEGVYQDFAVNGNIPKKHVFIFTCNGIQVFLFRHKITLRVKGWKIFRPQSGSKVAIPWGKSFSYLRWNWIGSFVCFKHNMNFSIMFIFKFLPKVKQSHAISFQLICMVHKRVPAGVFFIIVVNIVLLLLFLKLFSPKIRKTPQKYT